MATSADLAAVATSATKLDVDTSVGLRADLSAETALDVEIATATEEASLAIKETALDVDTSVGLRADLSAETALDVEMAAASAYTWLVSTETALDVATSADLPADLTTLKAPAVDQACVVAMAFVSLNALVHLNVKISVCEAVDAEVATPTPGSTYEPLPSPTTAERPAREPDRTRAPISGDRNYGIDVNRRAGFAEFDDTPYTPRHLRRETDL